MIISNYITPCIWLRMTPWPFSFTLPCMLKTLKTNIYDPASLVLVRLIFYNYTTLLQVTTKLTYMILSVKSSLPRICAIIHLVNRLHCETLNLVCLQL